MMESGTLQQLIHDDRRQSGRWFDLLADIVQEGIAVQNRDGILVYANRRLSDMLGYVQSEMRGHHWSEFFDDANAAIEKQQLNKLQDSEYLAYKIAWTAKDGHRVATFVSSIPIFDRQGHCRRTLMVVVDVSAHKCVEPALKDLRISSTQLLRNQELERKRIASELHDGIGQSLTAIKLYLENFDRLASQPSDTLDGEQPVLTNITPLLQETIDQVRQISMELRPSTLDELGLLATINWFLREFQADYPDIHLEAHIEIAEDDVPACYKTLIFRVLQEALNNISEHAQANFALIELKHRDGFIEMKLRDDGIGFELSEVLTQHPLQRGLGLASMKERCESVGGSFTVASSVGSGTLVLADWPSVKSQSYCCS